MGEFCTKRYTVFRKKLIRTEMNKARIDEQNVEKKLERARGAVHRG